MTRTHLIDVIPAQAGIQRIARPTLDPRLHGDDRENQGIHKLIPRMLHRGFNGFLSSLLTVSLSMVVSCSGDTTFAPSGDQGLLYMRLQMNHHAILLSTVSPYDTVRLTATPTTPRGDEWIPAGLSSTQIDSLLNANPATFISQDSTKVGVSNDGLVRAKAVTGPTTTVRVIATRTLGNVTWADTALVRVLNTPNPQTLTTFRIRPVDSLKVAIGSVLNIPLVALGLNNDTIKNVVTYVTTRDSLIVSWAATARTRGIWNPVSIGGRDIGTTQIVSEAYVYGVKKIDSFTVTTGYPILGQINIQRRRNAQSAIEEFLNFEIRALGPGGTMSVSNRTGLDTALGPVRAAEVIFDDPTQATPALEPARNSGGGNFTLPTLNSIAYRRFLNQGIHKYRVEPFGLIGTIIVKDR